MISIIIPTFNRHSQLKVTLSSFLNLTVENIDFEIIIIDNGSNDCTFEVVKKFIEDNPNLSVRYKFDSTPGLLTGRHLGASISRGDILTFIDDDVVLSKDWLKSIDMLLRSKSHIDLLTGPCLPLYEIYPPKWLNYFWSKSKYGGKICLWLSLLDLEKDEIEIDPNYVWGLNFTVRKSVFMELGGFNPDNIRKDLQMFQGDGETALTNKAKAFNKKALYSSGVLLYHQISKERLSFDYFDNRAFYAGVCNSFTSLRSSFMIEAIEPLPSLANRIYDKIKNLIFRIKISFYPQIRTLYKRFSLKENEGFLFHQENYRNNPKVREWVHKDNYIDFKLPDLNQR